MARLESRDVVDKVEQQDWLDPVADTIQNTGKAVLEHDNPVARGAKTFLHGRWMGHPFHAAMTDVPIGAWTVAAVLDVSTSPSMEKAADAAIGVGMAAATVTAAAGIADYYKFNDKRQRRLGALHALLNVGVTALYGASLVARAKGNRTLGRNLGWAAYGILGVSAYLGGSLVYEEKIGINHAPDQSELPDSWKALCAEAEVPEGSMIRRDVDSIPVLLTKSDGRIYAMAATCSHYGGPLDEGHLEDECVVCPWHQSKFRLEDGQCVDGPSAHNQPVLRVRTTNGQIEVMFAPQEQQKELEAAKNPYVA